MGDRGFMPAEPSNLKGFISMQFREEIGAPKTYSLLMTLILQLEGLRRRRRRRLPRGLKRVIKSQMLQNYWRSYKDHTQTASC